MTDRIPQNYFDLMCFLAGVTREDLEAADAFVRGLPAPYDNLRVMLEPLPASHSARGRSSTSGS